MAAEYYFGRSHMPLWQFVGLLIIFSILIGSPIFVCFVYHRRKERDRLEDVNRRASAQRNRPEFVVDGRDYYLLPFPSRDIKRRPASSMAGTPRREVSWGSTVPLLVLNGTPGPRNVSPIMGRVPPSGLDGATATSTEQEAVLNENFAERTGTITSLAYPQTAHRGFESANRKTQGGTGSYGTLGYMMRSTYTAAQSAYRGRHRLNFWSNWIQQVPWGKERGGRLEAIDEESVGSSRFSRDSRGEHKKAANANANTTSGASSTVDINVMTARGGVYKGVIVGSVGTLDSESSGYSTKGTPPTFEKVDPREPYNPSMARSLTRRLLKFGFDQVRDGVIVVEKKRGMVGNEEEDEEDERGRQVSGVWRKGVELKKRALERQKLENGNRLFSFQKKKMDDGDNDGEGDAGEQFGPENSNTNPEELAKTSIRDFAHAFNKDIVGDDDTSSGDEGEAISPTGTIRIHHIDEEEDQSIILPKDQETTAPTSPSLEKISSPHAPSSPFVDIDLSSSPNVTNENTAMVTTSTSSATISNASRAKIPMPQPTGTLRGRKTLRDTKSIPETQKMRMARNTPKNTMGRMTLQAGSGSSGEDIPGLEFKIQSSGTGDEEVLGTQGGDMDANTEPSGKNT
ncbi:hypothetical protein TWF718_003651 [Orbilia javanica]|uniref:Uncharacterized protein n=1 Tax=Orbilia javanica TaxID=47235 RepID=A0AAN8NA53_9PEZI